MKKYLLIGLIFIICLTYLYNVKNSTKMVLSSSIQEVDTSLYRLDYFFVKQEGDELLININTAPKDILMMLPSIGESIAQNIIEYRQKNGKFNSIDEIKNVRLIGEKVYEKIKDFITIGGENDLQNFSS